MIQHAAFEVTSDEVLIFGKTRLPKGIYYGAVEWLNITFGGGHTRRQVMRALVNVDRGFLERLGETVTPNLIDVDIDLVKYVKSGDVRILN